MFARYKKTTAADKAASAAPAVNAAPAPAKGLMQRGPQVTANAGAKPVSGDKDKKRKERMGEIKLELHKRLLDSLNLAALEHAAEADLRAEIVSISSEALEEMSIVLNKDDRIGLYQELYDGSAFPAW